MYDDVLHDCLKDLGAARSAGVFRPVPAASGCFPWNAPAKSFVHRGARWVRLAIPVAAAAALALAFVGTTLRDSRVGPHAANSLPPATAVVSLQGSDPADCNGDGLVNGADIDCFVRQNAVDNKVAGLQPEDLARRLLGI